MNRLCYRLVFNRLRGRLVPVAESAKSCTRNGGSAGVSQGKAAIGGVFNLRPLSLFLTLSFGLAAAPAWSQIVADPKAPANQRPTIVPFWADGRPQVNIQTPSAAGVSRNTYIQFDIQKEGVKLNNKRDWNPWLAKGEAKVILNEVNSTKASYLGGPIEVMGTQADVIIANPAGIVLNGAHFQGMPRLTLTTGVPVVSGGRVEAIDVRQGAVEVTSWSTGNYQGHTEILSRSVKLGASLGASGFGSLSVTTGAQRVDYADGQLTTIAGTGAVPKYAIDIAAPGSMYGGQISVLATEQGVGIRNAGLLGARSDSGQLILTVDGRLENSGTIKGAVVSVATVQGDIVNTGTLRGNQLLLASSGNNLSLGNVSTLTPDPEVSATRYILAAKQDVFYQSKAVVPGTVAISAGRNVNLASGASLETKGALQLNADGLLTGTNASLKSQESDVVLLAGGGMSLSGGALSGKTIHAETGKAFADTSANITLNNVNVASTDQLAMIASGKLFLNNPASNVLKSGGSTYLAAGKDIDLAPDSRLTAGAHLSAIAGGTLNMPGAAGAASGQARKNVLTATGDIRLAGDKVALSGSALSAQGDIVVSANEKGLVVAARENTDKTRDVAQLTAGGKIALSSIASDLDVALNASAKDIVILANGAATLRDAGKGEGKTLVATGDVVFGSVKSDAAVKVIGADIQAGGKANVLGVGQTQLTAVLAPSGTAFQLVSITGAKVSIQGKSVNANALVSSKGDLSVQASGGALTMFSDGPMQTRLTAGGGMQLEAAGDMTLTGVKANAAKSMSLSADKMVRLSADSLEAKEILGVSSGTGQEHLNGDYQGGAVFVYNKLNRLTLNNTRLLASYIASGDQMALSGQMAVESGGDVALVNNTFLTTYSDLSFIAGQGDIVLRPAGMTSANSFIPSQLDAERDLTVVARNGSVKLLGEAGIKGAPTKYTALSANRDLTVVGKDISAQGGGFYANRNLLVSATDNLSLSANKRTVIEGGQENTYWDLVSVYGGGQVDLLAGKNLNALGVNVQSPGKVTLQSGGNLSVSGLHSTWTSTAGGAYHNIHGIVESVLNGVQGVSVGALGGHLYLNGTNVKAQNGKASLQALGDIVLEAPQEHELYHLTTKKTKRTWYGKKKVKITTVHRESLVAQPVWIDGQDIEVKAGGNISTYATQFGARGNLKIEAGEKINYYAVQDQLNNSTTSSSSSSLWGIKYSSSKDSSTRSTLSGQVTKLQSQQDILSESGDDQLLQGTAVIYGGTATFAAGVGEKAKADARIILEGVKNRVSASRQKQSNYVVWQKMEDSGQVVETLTVPGFQGPTAPKFSAPGGLTVQLPASSDFKTQVQKLSSQAGQGYMNALMARKDVNWQPVKLAYDKWNYKQEGLTPAGAALVAVAVTWALGPGGAGVIGNTTTTAGLMADAAFASLASQATISLINNKGDLGKTLKELGSSQTVKATLAAALTAGVIDKLGATSTMQDLAKKTTFPEKLTYNLINATGRALTNTAINGGDLEEALKQALVGGVVDTAHGEVASQIKGLESQYLAHKLAHALAGCVAGAAAQGTCRDGAIGAAVGEVVAQMFEGQKPNIYTASGGDIQAYNEKVLGLSKLVAGAVAAYAGGDAQTAITTAETAVRNNYLNHKKTGLLTLSEVEKYEKAVTDCNNGDQAACGRRNALASLSQQRDLALQAACGSGVGADPLKCNMLADEARRMGNTVYGNLGGVVWANSPIRGFALNVAQLAPPDRPDNFSEALARSTATGLLLSATGPEDLIVGTVISLGGKAAVVLMESGQKVLQFANGLKLKASQVKWDNLKDPDLPPGAISGVNTRTGEVVVKLPGGSIVSKASLDPVSSAVVLLRADGKTIWVADISQQGKMGEELLGRQERGIGLHNSEPVIDVYDPLSGLVVSQKTLNWNTTGYTQKPQQIESTLKGYVNQLIAYQGTGGKTMIGSGEMILASQVKQKSFELVLPASGGSFAQTEAVNRVISYAKQNGIDFKVFKAQ